MILLLYEVDDKLKGMLVTRKACIMKVQAEEIYKYESLEKISFRKLSFETRIIGYPSKIIVLNQQQSLQQAVDSILFKAYLNT